MARAGADAPPRFEDLMLDGLGAIDDRVVLLARAGSDWEIRRLGRAVAECLGGGGRETRLSELAPDCGFALERVGRPGRDRRQSRASAKPISRATVRPSATTSSLCRSPTAGVRRSSPSIWPSGARATT